MLLFRWLLLLMGVGGAVCLAMFIATRDPRYRRIGLILIKWAVIAGLAFFAVLMLEMMVKVL